MEASGGEQPEGERGPAKGRGYVDSGVRSRGKAASGKLRGREGSPGQGPPTAAGAAGSGGQGEAERAALTVRRFLFLQTAGSRASHERSRHSPDGQPVAIDSSSLGSAG